MYKLAFPFYEHQDLAYWDTAATGLKLRASLDAEYAFSSSGYANVHRGIYGLAARASESFEDARGCLASAFGVKSAQWVFVRGATEGIALFAASVVAPTLRPGQNIVISVFEHHANLLVWRLLCEQKQCTLRVIAPKDQVFLTSQDILDHVDENTNTVAVTHVCHASGAKTPSDWIASVRSRGIWVLLDGAQMSGHAILDLGALDVDAYVMSAHKMYASSGLGAVVLSERALQFAEVYQVGGGMVLEVSDRLVWRSAPWCFEAGTPHITGAIGWAAACRWLMHEQEALQAHERLIFTSLLEAWREALPRMRLWTDPLGMGMVSFVVENHHPHDVASYADACGVALRAGKLCAEPLMRFWGVEAVLRVSVGCYNDMRDVERLLNFLERVG